MPPNSTLFAVLDCCHSGSALELPYVYKSDDEGNVSLIDNIRQGMHLMTEASDLLRGGFSFDKMAEAQDLYAGATSFFRSFKHMGEEQQSGLDEDENSTMYQQEHKMVTMFSGCRDDQTSADTNIGGMNEGAMSWAFLEIMKNTENPTYLQVTCSSFRSLVLNMELKLFRPFKIPEFVCDSRIMNKSLNCRSVCKWI